jgi:chromosomal replication initiator protein
MTASVPGLVCTDGAMSLWKSVLHAVAQRLAPTTREALVQSTRCLERTSDSLRIAANQSDLGASIRAGHIGAIEAALSSLTDGAVALALIPVDDVEKLKTEPTFTFATFIASPANSGARTRARGFANNALASGGGVAIHGAVGAGKSHLLRAIAAVRVELDPAAGVLYRCAEQLSLDLVSAISTEEVASFCDRLLASSTLLLDNIEALHGREATQDELLRSLNLAEERSIPVAIALKRPPERCLGLIEPLRRRLARFESIELRPPEWETRVAIVLARTRRWGVEPKPAVAALLASRLRGNLARLDVLLTRLMTQLPYSGGLDDIEAVMHLLGHAADPLIRVTTEDVLNAVSQQFNVRPRDLRSASRSPRITTPRQIAMYLVRRHCGLSYPEIGRRFAKHHTTALHSDRVVQNQLGENASLRSAVLLIEKELIRVSEDGV